MLKKIDLESIQKNKVYGKVVSVNGPLVTAKIPNAKLGDYCDIYIDEKKKIGAKIVAFHDDLIKLSPFDELKGIVPNSKIESTRKSLSIRCSKSLLGTVCNAFGNVVSKDINLKNIEERDVETSPPNPIQRRRIDRQFITGISSIDLFCPIGIGQRLGLFASAGVGKTTLLTMIAKNSKADVNVIALVGERGREIQEFIEDTLKESGIDNTIIVATASSERAALREVSAKTATTIAEYFRDLGKDVLLMVDSLTRVARATREIALLNGELPIRQGYPASVFSELPSLLERSGNNEKGSITAIYTILKNPDGEIDPLAEEITSILDGHIVLDKELANYGIRPAIDIVKSLSRLQTKLLDSELLGRINIVKQMTKKLEDEKDVLLFGGKPDSELKKAIKAEKQILELRNQKINEFKSKTKSIEKLNEIYESLMLEVKD